MTVVRHSSNFSVSPIEDKTETPHFLHNWGDVGRIAGGVEQPHRTRLPGCTRKMAEAMETMHTRGRRLLRGWWWRPKLVFDQIAAPVSQILEGSLCVRTRLYKVLPLTIHCHSAFMRN
jgi:hypothetical protein